MADESVRDDKYEDGGEIVGSTSFGAHWFCEVMYLAMIYARKEGWDQSETLNFVVQLFSNFNWMMERMQEYLANPDYDVREDMDPEPGDNPINQGHVATSKMVKAAIKQYKETEMGPDRLMAWDESESFLEVFEKEGQEDDIIIVRRKEVTRDGKECVAINMCVARLASKVSPDLLENLKKMKELPEDNMSQVFSLFSGKKASSLFDAPQPMEDDDKKNDAEDA